MRPRSWRFDWRGAARAHRTARRGAARAGCGRKRSRIQTSILQVLGLWPPHGGMFAFNKNGLEEKAVPLVLQKSGYRTGLVGK